MNRTYAKLIVGGILLGVAVYFVPFFIMKVFVFFIILGMFSWFFRGRRRQHRQYYWAMADRIRSMSDEEFEQFKEQRSHCGRRWSNTKNEEA